MNRSILLAAYLSVATWAASAAEAPTVTYLGNHPADNGLEWTETQNGVTHDDNHWYLTQEARLWKIPVTWDLANDFDAENLPAGVLTVGVPLALRECNLAHFGDLEQVDGYLLGPVEHTAPPELAKCPTNSVLAVFRASDLAFINYFALPEQRQRFPWIAYNPVDGLLYSSENSISSDRPLYRYELNRDLLTANCTYNNFAQCNLNQIVIPKDTWSVHEADGSPLSPLLGRYIQGGDFSEEGYLYLVNGMSSPERVDRRTGVHVIGPDGRIVADSFNPYVVCGDDLTYDTTSNCGMADPDGTFRFEYNFSYSAHEEPEGADWWDLDDGRAPGIRGQLHVVVLDNDWPDQDGVFFKHYRVAEPACGALCDRDGDGLLDTREAELGTNPGSNDTDGDGITDGDEVNSYQTDPLNSDSDSDGLADGEEIELYHTHPNFADSDGDGLSDGREVDELHTNPLDVDSDDDGLLDGVEIEVGTDPNDSDSDNDGLVDGRDVEFVEQQLLAMLDTAFRSRGPGAREQLLQHLTVLESAVQANNRDAARAALDLLLRMMNGCGTAPDADDVVRDCASQPPLRELLALLRLNLGLT